MVIVFVVAVGSANAAFAEPCSTANLKGSYGYTEVGAPWNVVGVMKFDGAGTVINDVTIVFIDGSLNQSAEDWSYQVGADCKFTMTNLQGQQYFGIIVSEGRELRWVIGVDGFVAKAEAHKLPGND
jgi:hypothetical protein